MKKHAIVKRSLKLEKQVVRRLSSPDLQKVIGGLSFNDACGTAFICGTQVGCDR